MLLFPCYGEALIRKFKALDEHFAVVGVKRTWFVFDRECVAEAPCDDGFVVLVQKLDGHVAALNSIVDHSVDPVEEAVVGSQRAALEGNVVEGLQPRHLVYRVVLVGTFTVFDGFGANVQTGHFRKGYALVLFSVPFHTQMKASQGGA